MRTEILIRRKVLRLSIIHPASPSRTDQVQLGLPRERSVTEEVGILYWRTVDDDDSLMFYVSFNSIQVILRRRKGDNEWLCNNAPSLQLWSKFCARQEKGVWQKKVEALEERMTDDNK